MKPILEYRFLSFCLMILLLGLVSTGIAGAEAKESPEPDHRWSVLLITVDCMRPDHMSVYGYHRKTTPHLEKFAQDALVFENAFATSAWTVPGVVSMFTGYYPPVHGQNGRFGYYDKEMAAPLRVLAEEGYEILGDSIQGPAHEDFGFQKKLDRVKPYLENFIEKRPSNPKPFFAWVHLRETHLAYNPSKRNAKRWVETSRTSEGIEAVKEHHVILRNPQEGLKFKHIYGVNFAEEDIPIIRALYDGEMADADARLGKALGRMKKSGLLQRTIVVITADHGEELFEHGWLGHASTSYDGKLYDELIRVPLIIRVPDASLKGRFKALVQGVDLMPTLLEILGVDASRIRPEMQGRSLMPLVKGTQTEVRKHVFMQTTRRGWTTPKEEVKNRILSVRSLDRKLHLIPQGEGYATEGYDLRADPQESRNIYAEQAGDFAGLEQALKDWSARNLTTVAALVLDAAERRQENLEQELGDGDLLGAVREWDALEVMHQTWSYEAEPFYTQEPYAEPWSRMRRYTAELITNAMRCEARGSRFRYVPPAKATEAGSVACRAPSE